MSESAHSKYAPLPTENQPEQAYVYLEDRKEVFIVVYSIVLYI